MNRDLSAWSFTILVGLTISDSPNPPRCKQHGGNVGTETSRSTCSLQFSGRGGPRKDTSTQHLCRAFKNNMAEDGCHHNHLELLTRLRDMPRCPQRSATSEILAAIAGCGIEGAHTVSPIRGRPSCGAHARRTTNVFKHAQFGEGCEKNNSARPPRLQKLDGSAVLHSGWFGHRVRHRREPNPPCCKQHGGDKRVEH